MRTLKKTLALVLVVAMVLSFGVIGANAAFTDVTEKTDYNEAVTVLTKLGVINGMTDTTFAPDGTLTREQAAKIIAYVKLGPTNAKLIGSASSSRFTDVAADRWSAGYIEYCANLGIIKGLGDGTFAPEGKLTTAAFTKMLLVAVGFDAVKDGLEGEGWAINAAALAIKAEVNDEDIAISDALNITRAQACQLALNCMLYSDSTTSKTTTYYIVNGATYTTFAAAQAALTAGQTISQITVTEDVAVDSLGYKVFGLVKAVGADDFGRPATTYNASKWTSALQFVWAPVVSYNTPVTEKKVFEDLGATGIAGSSAKFVVVDAAYVDGQQVAKAVKQSATWYSADNTLPHYNNGFDEVIAIAKNDTIALRGSQYGTVTEFYKVATNHYVMVVVNEYFGTVTNVTKANATTGADRYITVDGMDYETEDFAKTDSVLYTKADGVIMDVVAPGTVTGTVTKIVNGTDYTIGDVVTHVSYKNTLQSALSVTNKGTWYTDSCGNVIAVKSATAATVYYGYLLAYAAQQYSTSDLLGTGAKDAKEIFKFVDASGATVTLNGAFTTNATTGKVTAFVNSSINASTGAITENSVVADSKLFAYTLDASGNIATVEAATYTQSAASKTLTKGTATFDSKFMSDKTVIFYADDTNGKYAVYTGYASAPDKTTTAVYGYVGTGTAVSPLKALVLNVSDVTGTTAAKHVYFASAAKSVEITAAGTVYTYTNVYLDGVKGELKFLNTDPAATAGQLFVFTTNTTTGFSTLSGQNLASSTEITAINSSYFYAGATKYTDASTVYYMVDATAGTVEVVTALTALSATDAYSVNLIYTDGTDNATTGAANVVYFYVGA